MRVSAQQVIAPGGAELNAAQSAELAKIATIESELASTAAKAAENRAWIKAANGPYKVGVKVFNADNRRIEVAGVAVQITYTGVDDYTLPALTAAELAKWEYVGQESTPIVYPAGAIAPIGFKYRRTETGQVFELLDNVLLPANFDASQWRLESGQSLLEVKVGPYNIFAAASIVESSGTFNRIDISNGPNNAAQNVTGTWNRVGNTTVGAIILDLVDGTNIATIGGTWINRYTTATSPPNVGTKSFDGWSKVATTGAYIPSAPDKQFFSPDKVLWDLSHNIVLNFTGDGPITLRPTTDWSNRTGGLTVTGGNPLRGSLPLSGSAPCELTYTVGLPGGAAWVVSNTPSSNRATTVHNAGVTAPIALNGRQHHLAEVHVEDGANYTINAGDWADGQRLEFLHTAGHNTGERLIATGFAGVFLRDGSSLPVSNLYIGRQDANLELTITKNGGAAFLNIKDRSIDAHSVQGYITPPAGITAGMLLNISGNTIQKADAIAPGVLGATHYIDAVTGAATAVYGDGCRFPLPTYLVNPIAGQILYLGEDGLFSLSKPPFQVGTILQDVGFVRVDGWGQIKLGRAEVYA